MVWQPSPNFASFNALGVAAQHSSNCKYCAIWLEVKRHMMKGGCESACDQDIAICGACMHECILRLHVI